MSSVPFTDQDSFWTNLCAAAERTNGVDRKLPNEGSSGTPASGTPTLFTRRKQNADQDHPPPKIAALPDLNYQRVAIDLPEPFVPTTDNATGSSDVFYFTMLPNTSVGVMVAGTFLPQFFREWEQQVLEGIANLVSQGADHLIIDVTNNPGGYICAGHFVRRGEGNLRLALTC